MRCLGCNSMNLTTFGSECVVERNTFLTTKHPGQPGEG